MTSFHPRGLQAVRAQKSKSKRPRSNSDSFQEEDLRQGFQWVSEHLMWMKKNLICACLRRLALPSRAVMERAFPSILWQCSLISLGGKKSTLKKKCSFFLSHLSPLPIPLKQRKSLPFGAASSYLNLEKLGEGSYATVYKGISRWVTHNWERFCRWGSHSSDSKL